MAYVYSSHWNDRWHDEDDLRKRQHVTTRAYAIEGLLTETKRVHVQAQALTK